MLREAKCIETTYKRTNRWFRYGRCFSIVLLQPPEDSEDKMKEYSNEELKEIYRARRNTLAREMRSRGVGACVFIDSEEHREPALPYFTNHPSDAVLIIFSDGYTTLIPWDENLARQQALYDKLVPYTRYTTRT